MTVIEKGIRMYANEPVVTVELIGPDQAKLILEHNTRNRTLTPGRAEVYASAMRQGRWMFNGETLKFDIDGRLIDGQHRLLAVILSGTTQRFTVVRNLPHEAQETVDTGRARTFRDTLKLRGETNHSVLAAATSKVYAYEWTGIPVPSVSVGSGTGGSVRRHNTIQELSVCLERHPALRESASAMPSARLLLLTYSDVVALHYLFSSVNRDDADTFFERARDGRDLEDGDPILALRSRMVRDLQNSAKTRDIVVIALAIRAFNGWRRGEYLTRLQWKPGGAAPDRFPVIEDCTVPRLGVDGP